MTDIRRFDGAAFLATVPFRQILAEELLLRMVHHSAFPPRFPDEDSASGVLERRGQRRACEHIVRDLVNEGALVELSGGRYARNPLQEEPVKITFSFGGETYTIPREEYNDKLAELRARTPEAIQRSKIESLEAQLQTLKESLQ